MFYPTGNNTKGRMLVCISDIEPELDDTTCDCDDSCMVGCVEEYLQEKNYCTECWQMKEYLKSKGMADERIDEDMEGGLASLDTVGGMGMVAPPSRGSVGSGDRFDTLSVGTPSSKNPKRRLMRFSDFKVKKKK